MFLLSENNYRNEARPLRTQETSCCVMIVHKSLKVYFRQGDRGDKGDRGYTTTLKGEQFPSGVFEGPPGPPGPPGKHTNEIICIRDI